MAVRRLTAAERAHVRAATPVVEPEPEPEPARPPGPVEPRRADAPVKPKGVS